MPDQRARSGVIRLFDAGSVEHERALQQLESVGCAVPECWRPTRSAITSDGDRRWWVSDGDAERPLGFMMRASHSRRVPWARIARVEYLGDPHFAARANEVAALIRQAVAEIGRVMRVEVRVFNRDPAIRSALTSALAAHGFTVAPKHALYRLTRAVSIAGSAEDVFERLPTNVRRRIRDALGAGLVIRYGATPSDVPRLLDLMQAAFARTRGRLQREKARQDLLIAIAAPAHRPLVTLERPNVSGPARIAAFALGAANGDHVTYIHGATERGGDLARLSLAYAPVWELMRWATEHGANWFDLGGIPPTTDPSHPLAGIAAFKRRFGGEDIEVATEMHCVINPGNTRLERLVGRLLPR